MRRATLTIILALLLTGVVFAAGPVPAMAADGACSVRQAHAATHSAERALARAKARLREARHVESSTRTYGLRYGNGVGRWTRLARRTGWQWAQLPTLMFVISRESGGDPCAKNPSSTASGLLQLLAFHWSGKFNPFIPSLNLKCGLRLYKESGWLPWQVMQ
jgi:hypothetical protein